MQNFTPLNLSVSLDFQQLMYLVLQLPKEYQIVLKTVLETQTNTTETEQENIQPIPLQFGAGKHLVKFMADDFNAAIDDFNEYM